MLPPAFIERLAQVVPPDRLDPVIASFALEKPACLWLNPLTAAPADTLAELGRDFPAAHFTPLLPSAVVAHDADPAALARAPAVTEGRAYLINPSSLIPPLVLAPTPDDAVLDLCAAPGGKTLQLAAALASDPAHPVTGHLAAVEAVRPRFFKLRAILDRYGALKNPGVRLFMKDGRAVGGAVPERFDKILLDAPCSSEARFDAADADSSRHWSPRKVAECAHKQRALLRSALTALKVGGTLVYCTCSFSLEENEHAVNDVLAELDGAVVPIPTPVPALAPDAPASQIPAIPGLAGLTAAWRILPDALFDGFFLVRLEKRAPLPMPAPREGPARARPRPR